MICAGWDPARASQLHMHVAREIFIFVVLRFSTRRETPNVPGYPYYNEMFTERDVQT